MTYAHGLPRLQYRTCHTGADMITQLDILTGGLQYAFSSANNTLYSTWVRERIPGRPALRAGGNEPAFDQELEVLAEGRLGHTHILNEIPNPMFTRCQMLENSQARRLGKRLKYQVL